MTHEQQPDRVTMLRFSSTEQLPPRVIIPIARAAQELYTKCWLISQGRITDLELYGESRSNIFEEQAGVRFHRGITANEEGSPEAATTFELSVPATNDPKILQAVQEAISSMTKKRPPL